MSDAGTQFLDGDAYERLMGRWSRMAGEKFLNWLAVPNGLYWLDVGCGNGAFTESLIAGSAPAAVGGIDPSRGTISLCPRTAGRESCDVWSRATPKHYRSKTEPLMSPPWRW